VNTDFIDLKELSFYIMFAVLYFVVPWIVVKASYSIKTKFDLRSLWERKGGKSIDGLFVILICTWWVHTSSMILWTIVQKVQTQDYLTYMAWGTLILAKILGQAFGNGQKPEIEKPSVADQVQPGIV
jgi:hypothetical protein